MYKWMEIKIFPISEILIQKENHFKFMEIGVYCRN